MIFKIQKHRIVTMPVGSNLEHTEPALPSLPRMAVTAAREAVKVVAHAARTGRVMVAPVERERRKSICVQCPLYRPSDGRCGHENCGCKLALKAAMDCMKCPDTPPRW